MTTIDMLRDRLKLKKTENRAALIEDMKQLFRETQALSDVSEITDDEIEKEIARYRTHLVS